MANTFLTPAVIAQAALATLYETCVMAQLVHRDYSSEFVAQIGDTVTIRKPAVFTAQEYNGTSINIQDATENSVPVVLNHWADTSFAVTSKDLSLKIKDFTEQLLNPAMESISQKIDRDTMAFRNDITQVVGQTGTWTYDKPESLVDAGVLLDVAKVPTTERRVVVGPVTRGKWLQNDLVKTAGQSGSTAALREGSIGNQLWGFDAYMSQNIGQPKAPGSQVTGDPTTEVNVAFHRTAVALVTRQLQLPMGAANAYIASYKGFGIRVVIGYDQQAKKDVVSLDTLYGVKTLDANRAALIQGPYKA